MTEGPKVNIGTERSPVWVPAPIPSPCQGCRFAVPCDPHYVRCSWLPAKAPLWFEWDAVGRRLRGQWTSPAIDPPQTCDVREPAA